MKTFFDPVWGQIRVGFGTDVPAGTDERLVRMDGTLALQDNSSWVIKDAGQMLYGITTSRPTNGFDSQLQIERANPVSVLLARDSNDVSAPQFRFAKSRGTTVGSYTAVTADTELLDLQAFGADGTADVQAARLHALVDGPVSAGIVPGRWVFETADAAGVMRIAFRLLSTQQTAVQPGSTVLPGLTGFGDTDTGVDWALSNVLNFVAGAAIQSHITTNGLFVDRAIHLAEAAYSADQTLDASHTDVWFNATGANRTATLPAAAGCTGRVYGVGKNDSSTNTVTIDPNGAELINGAATFVVASQYEFIRFKSDGTGWLIQ